LSGAAGLRPLLTRHPGLGEGNGWAGAERDSIMRLREHLAAEDAAVCLICLELLLRDDPVWSCGTCYDSVHLACIQVSFLLSP